MLKKLTFIIAATALLVASCAVTVTKRETTGEEANPPTPAVRIEAVFMQGIGSGSGSHIGNGQILTNKHVCDMLNDSFIQRVISFDGTINTIRSMINSPDSVIDLCLVKIDDANLPVVVFEDANIDQIGKLGTVIGYPSGMYAQIQGRVMGSTIFLVESTPEYLTLLGAPSAPGVSGSGVYSEGGKMIGVVNAGNRQITLFVPLAVVKEFINVALRPSKN